MKKGILSTISFILFLCVFCIGSLIIPDKKYSEMENRSLSEFPKISVSSLLSGETQGELTTYSSDQLILRDFLVSLKVSAQNALGKKDIGEVYLGEDDYYIEKKLEIDESIMNGNIDAISLFSKNHKELNPVFIPILTKGEVLKDKLPKGAMNYSQKAYLEKIKAKIPRVVDTEKALKNDGSFYKTDHHWTTLGAYSVYKEFCKLNGKTPSVLEIETTINDFYGTLYSKAPKFFVSGEKMEIPKIKSGAKYIADGKEQDILQKDYLSKKDKYAAFLGGNCAKGEIRNLKGKGNLLIIKDSFANSFVPFILEDYENIIMIDTRYYKDSVEKIIKEENITDALILCSMDTLAEENSIPLINY